MEDINIRESENVLGLIDHHLRNMSEKDKKEILYDLGMRILKDNLIEVFSETSFDRATIDSMVGEDEIMRDILSDGISEEIKLSLMKVGYKDDKQYNQRIYRGKIVVLKEDK